MNKKLFENIILSLPKKAKVLDAGCGSGNNSRYIHDLRADLEIIGIDISLDIKKHLPKYLKFKQLSVEDLSTFKEGTFDCILCFRVLEHVKDTSKAASEFLRVLKKGGYIFAESPHWISTITPIGFNFYDDPTHIRPFNTQSFSRLFSDFTIDYLKFETAIFFYLDELYQLNKFSLWFLIRKLLKILGIYKTAIFIIAKKKQ